MYDIFYIGKRDNTWKNFKENYITAKHAESIIEAQQKCLTEFFWVVPDDIVVDNEFEFDYSPDEWSKEYVHVFLNKDTFDGVSLIPKNYKLIKRECDYRFFISKKEVDLVASTPKPFDVFYIDTWEDYEYAIEHSSTEMFWAVSHNLKYDQSYINNFYFSHHNSYDRKENHAFVHDVDGRKLYNGVFLCSKNKPLNKREIEYRFLVNAKQWDDVASGPRQYDIFVVNNYEEYLDIMDYCATEMFWVIPPHVQVCDDFKFDLYFSHDNEYDRKINHVFLNGETYDGIILATKHVPISKKEFEHKFIISKKEHAIIASHPIPYEKFTIDTYEEYLTALNSSSTEMFWGIPSDVVVDFDFNYFVPAYDTFHRSITHTFLNDTHYDGICLFSKNNKLSEREIKHRFYANKKEVEIVASHPVQYQKYNVTSYEDYEHAFENSTLDMFWIVPTNVCLEENFAFDEYFSHHNQYDRNINHVYLNGKYHDGVILASKNSKITRREFEFGHIINKKEHAIIASRPKPYDIVFISYNEPNADENFEKLKQQFPDKVIHRVHGVKGIHQAHIMAAKTAETEMFYVVDGDAQLVNEFNFNYQVPKWSIDNVHIWRSRNPINGLEYGYGGVKLLPRQLTINVDVNSPDMTTSISNKLKVMETVSNYSMFNTDAFNTWKSAFRECVKLSSKTIRGQINEETERRLKIWCERGLSAEFGRYAISGACSGRDYGYDNRDRPDKLNLINDFDWLYEQFSKHTLG